LKIAITGFQRRQKQLIDWIQTSYADMPRKDNLSPTGNYLLSKNISSVTTSGFETDIQYLKKFKNDLQLISSLGFVWLESRSASSTPSFYLSSHAKYLSNFYAEILKKKFSLSITAIYKNRTEQDAPNINSHVDANCFMMNLNAGYYLSAQRLKIFLQVDNIFDNACADLLGTQTPGRWLMGGINFSF
jgi:iron complex outermembrane receptor protein